MHSATCDIPNHIQRDTQTQHSIDSGYSLEVVKHVSSTNVKIFSFLFFITRFQTKM